jgi:hypothetical protein
MELRTNEPPDEHANNISHDSKCPPTHPLPMTLVFTPATCFHALPTIAWFFRIYLIKSSQIISGSKHRDQAFIEHVISGKSRNFRAELNPGKQLSK